MPEDLELLPELERERFVGNMGDGSAETESQELIPGAVKTTHPDYREKGAEMPLGFMPASGENRRARRAAVATWAPPTLTEGEQPPTRRELWAQRQKQRRGALDPELRRLQRERLNQK
jgi:hypothetical protein